MLPKAPGVGGRLRSRRKKERERVGGGRGISVFGILLLPKRFTRWSVRSSGVVLVC